MSKKVYQVVFTRQSSYSTIVVVSAEDDFAASHRAFEYLQHLEAEKEYEEVWTEDDDWGKAEETDCFELADVGDPLTPRNTEDLKEFEDFEAQEKKNKQGVTSA